MMELLAYEQILISCNDQNFIKWRINRRTEKHEDYYGLRVFVMTKIGEIINFRMWPCLLV